MSVRNEKIASVIKRAISTIISKLAKENNFGLASISMVKLSKDLKIANIYVNLLILNPQEKSEKIQAFLHLLNANSGLIRSTVAKEVRMRFMPELRYFYDDTLEQIENIENLLNKVKTDAPYKENYGDEDVYDSNKILDIK